MKKLDNNLVLLCHDELLIINGGTDRSKEGEAVGEFVGEVISGVLKLVGILTLRRFF